MRTFPAKLRNDGRGIAIDEASGQPVRAQDRARDHRQGMVHKDRADYTKGFGTLHPQDVRDLGMMDDPSPVPEARTGVEWDKETVAQKLGWTLRQVDDYILEHGRLPT